VLVKYVDVPRKQSGPGAVKAIARRLRRLEERLRLAIRATAAYDPSVPAQLRATLAAAGFVAGPVESLTEVWARAMGITCLDLRALLERRRPAE
jgi:hypothetical protein